MKQKIFLKKEKRYESVVFNLIFTKHELYGQNMH
jgi:hypothetical protein